MFFDTIARGSLIVFSLRILGAACAFIFNIILARSLGAEGAGVYFLAGTIVSVSTVIGRLGLDNTLLRFIAANTEKQAYATVNTIYKLGIGLATISAALVTIIVYLSAATIANSLFHEPALELPLQLMSLSIVPLSLLNLHAEILKALRRAGLATLIQGLAIPLVGNALLILLAPRYGVLGAACASAITSLLVMLLSVLVWLKFRPVVKEVASTDIFTYRTLLNTSLPLLAVALLNLVIDFSDTIMIGMYLTSASVGVYAVALSITRVSSILLTSVNSVVAPEFSSLWASGKITELNILARAITKQMGIIALVFVSILLIFPSEILLIFGQEFQVGSNTLVILALGQFIALATGPVAYLLMMTGHEKFHRNNVLFSAVLNIILNYLFIPIYGIAGAAWATTISLSIKNIIAVYFVRSKLGIKVLL